MPFTSTRTRALRGSIWLGMLVSIAAVQRVMLPIPPAHSVLGCLAVAPLWLLAGAVAGRRALGAPAALGLGIGLGAATVAATGMADTVAAPLVFLLGAAVLILVIDQQTGRNHSAAVPASRVDLLLERVPAAANDLRLVR